MILAEGVGSELVREGAGTSTEDVSSGIKPSRTSEASPGSLPQKLCEFPKKKVRSLTFLVRKSLVRAKAAHGFFFVQ
ncbi:hypothetical protein F2S71_13700 [Pseudomonas syringae pv. actinidiae]|nr:hypothetical protein [Pseudomonas syringae pv. actinidiae]